MLKEIANSFVEDYFADLSRADRETWVVLPNETRRNAVRKKWTEFLELRSDREAYLNVRFLTPVEVARKVVSLNGKRLITSVEQKILFRLAVEREKNPWGEIPGLSDLVRKAYSVRIYSESKVKDNAIEKYFVRLCETYRGFLSKAKGLDQEQLTVEFLADGTVSPDITLWLELFPAGTLRMMKIFRRLYDFADFVMVPPPFSGPSGKDNSFSEIIAGIHDEIENTAFSPDFVFEKYFSDLDEISAHLDWAAETSGKERVMVMTEPEKYRKKYERLSSFFGITISGKKNTLAELPVANLLFSLVDLLTEPEKLSGWTELMGQGAEFVSISGERMDFLYHLMLVSREHLTEETVEALDSFITGRLLNDTFLMDRLDLIQPDPDGIKQVWSDFIEIKKSYFPGIPERLHPDKFFPLIGRILKVITFSDDGETDTLLQARGILDELEQLLRKYEIMEFPRGLIRDLLRIYLGDAKFREGSSFNPVELYALEDLKNYRTDEIWISGFSLPAFPLIPKETNSFIPEDIRMEIQREKRIEQRAAFWQLARNYRRRGRLSFAGLVDEQERQGSLLIPVEKWKSVNTGKIKNILRKKYTGKKILEIATGENYYFPGTLSLTAVNEYLKCPQKFFWQYVARISPLPEFKEEVSPGTFGSFIHKLFELLFRENELIRCLKEKTFVDEDDLSGLMIKLAKENFLKLKRRPEWSRLFGDPVNVRDYQLWFSGLEKKDTLEGFLIRALKNQASYFTEMLKNHKLETIDTEKRIKRKIGGIEIKGVLDRVDWFDKGEKAVIWDYKTGSSSILGDELSLKNIQRELYSWLLLKSTDGSLKNVEAYYHFLQEEKYKQLSFKDNLRKAVTGRFKDKRSNPEAAKELYFRLTGPEKTVMSRLSGAELPEVPEIDNWYMRDEKEETEEIAGLRNLLDSRVEQYFSASGKFYSWLITEMKKFYYPGITDRYNCGYCQYASVCGFYWEEA